MVFALTLSLATEAVSNRRGMILGPLLMHPLFQGSPGEHGPA